MLSPPAPAFGELSPSEQGRRLSRLARSALRAYGITPRTIRRVREGFCTTFRATDHRGHTVALKAWRVGLETMVTRRSEAEWAQHLHDHGVPVARLLATATGAAVTTGSEPLAGVRPCVAYSWIPGRRQRSRVSAESARALGRLIAGAHEAASVFQSATFHRKTWNVDWMCGKWSGPDPLCDRLADSDLQLVSDWHARIESVCEDLERKPASWGPILADVGPHNIVWSTRAPWLIDFNDTGWGYYSYDLAILWQTLTDLRGSTLEMGLLDGYSEIRELPTGWGVEMQAAAIIRLLRWRAQRSRSECERLMVRLRDLGQSHTPTDR